MRKLRERIKELKERIKTNLIERLCVAQMEIDKKIKYIKIIHKW